MDATVDKGQLLVVSYAYPPLKVPVAPCAAKAVRSLKEYGYHVDVIAADIFPPLLGYRDDSLQSYIEEGLGSVTYITPKARSRVEKVLSMLPHAKWRARLLQYLSHDAMLALRDVARTELRSRLRDRPDAVILSFAPFHSVNTVIASLKKEFPCMKWIAQFSDPWANNPLQHNPYARLWSWWHEPRTIARADYIIHNSPTSLELMMRRYGNALRDKSAVIYHPFDAALYPRRLKASNQYITLRYVGALFEDRTPNSLFIGMAQLINRRPGLAQRVKIELVGSIDPQMLATPEANALPHGLVISRSPVSYVESLTTMYDADILVLIESDSACNLFMSSKLSDYVGACRPILAIVPPGPARDALMRLGSPWVADSSDVNAISLALEKAIDYVLNRETEAWADVDVYQQFSLSQIGAQYDKAIAKVQQT